MFKKKSTKVIVTVAVSYMIFVILGIIGFKAVQKSNNTPIDQAVKSYFYFDESFINEYDNIYSIGRNRLYDIVEDENTIKVAYNVYSDKLDFVMYVTLEKHEDGKLVVSSYEIIKELI